MAALNSVCGIHIRQAGRGTQYAIVDIAAYCVDATGDTEEFSTLVSIESGMDVQFGALRGLNLTLDEINDARSWLEVKPEIENWISKRVRPGDPIIAANDWVAYAISKKNLRLGFVAPFHAIANTMTWLGQEVSPIVPMESEFALETARLIALRSADLFLRAEFPAFALTQEGEI